MAAAALCVALPVALIAYRMSPEIGEWLDRADVGQIIVNSPTVYTRQRLVNDRLSQTQWLQEQLKQADRDFRSIAQLRRSFVERAFMLGEAPATPPSANSTATTPPPTGSTGQRQRDPDGELGDDSHVKLTTAALFRAKNSYREEVRAEMTQTQLDDRHDIQGNTIYRLAFDATILAGTKKNAAAAIKVTIGHHPMGDKPQRPNKSNSAAAQAQPNNQNKTLRKLYDDDYQQLYLDWIRYTQTQIEKSLTNISSSIPSNTPEPRARLLFTQFLLIRICELTLGITDLSDEFSAHCDPDHRDATTNVRESAQAKANLRRAGDLLNAYVNVRFALISKIRRDRFIGSLKRLRVLNDQATEDDQQRWIRQAQTYCYQSNKFSIAPIEIQIYPAAPAKRDDPPKIEPPEYLDCPFIDSPAERMIAGILLYTQLFNLALPRATSNDLPDNLASAFDEARPEGFTRLLVERLKRPNLNNPGCLRDKPDEAVLCDYPNQQAATRCVAADFARVNLNAFERRFLPLLPMKQFLNLEISGREINDCQLIVSALPKKDEAIRKLKASLNRSTETFAYSISPKNLSESISSSEETKNAFDAMARLRLSLTDKDASNSFGLRRSSSDRIDSNLPYPLVVGFGSSRQFQADGLGVEYVKLGEASADESTAIRTAVVGWLIAPRPRSGGRAEQIDGQHSLTAVISVPSWWRSVELDIETCWVSREDLRTLTPTDAHGIEVCKEGAKQIDSTVIRLPGAIQELSRKLGFEVVQEPYLNSDPPQRLEVGEPGHLLLSGGRLWRSTEVTIGSQKADSITVLPNMEGVVAKFNCVLPQSGVDRPGPDGRTITTTMLRVWTSEGVTFPVSVDLVRPRESAGRGPEQPSGQQPPNQPPSQVTGPAIGQAPGQIAGQAAGQVSSQGVRQVSEVASGPAIGQASRQASGQAAVEAAASEPSSINTDNRGRRPPKFCPGWYDDIAPPNMAAPRPIAVKQ